MALFRAKYSGTVIWVGDKCARFQDGIFQTEDKELIDGIKNVKDFNVNVMLDEENVKKGEPIKEIEPVSQVIKPIKEIEPVPSVEVKKKGTKTKKKK